MLAANIWQIYNEQGKRQIPSGQNGSDGKAQPKNSAHGWGEKKRMRLRRNCRKACPAQRE